jgi:hypothetical protein
MNPWLYRLKKLASDVKGVIPLRSPAYEDPSPGTSTVALLFHRVGEASARADPPVRKDLESRCIQLDDAGAVTVAELFNSLPKP